MKSKTKSAIGLLLALVLTASTAQAGEKTSLATINKNCGNIKYSKNNKWLGQIGSHKGFCAFSDEAYGARAAFKILQKRDGQTLKQIIFTWSPAADKNNPAQYTAFAEKVTGLKSSEKIDSDSERELVLRAIARMEGSKITNEQIAAGIALAKK